MIVENCTGQLQVGHHEVLGAELGHSVPLGVKTRVGFLEEVPLPGKAAQH